MVAVQSRYISSQFNEKAAAREDASSPVGNLLDSWLVSLASYFPGYTPTVSRITLADNTAHEITGTAPVSIPTSYGRLVVQSNGTYQFIADNANTLGAGTTVTENFRFTVKSGAFNTTASITVTITGTNDQPVVAVDSGNVMEGATLAVRAAAGVLANDSDVDRGDTLVVSRVGAGTMTLPTSDSGNQNGGNGQVGSAVNGTYGQLTLNRDGSYSYVANTEAANALKAGQTATDVFTYQVSDGKGGLSQTTLTLRVTGSNDGPAAQADTASVTENRDLTKTASQGLLANDSDGDGDRLTVLDISTANTRVAASNTGTQGISGTYGQLTFSANGAYSFRADSPQANSLKAGQTASETFTYRISDGQGGISSATLTIRVTGANDGPTATADTASLNENGVITKTAAQGLLANDTDIDRDTLTVTGVSAGNQISENGSIGQSVAGRYGHLTVNANGSYTYRADTSEANALKLGETATDTFSYRISDGKGGVSTTTLTLQITGRNDDPLAQADTGSVAENGKLTVGTANGLLSNDSDLDGDKLSVTGVAAGEASPLSGNLNKAINGTYGQLTVHNNGNYEYQANSSAANGLRTGETATEVFSYRISDGQGGTAVSTLTITVTGKNDAPIATADRASVSEAAALSISAGEGVLSNDRDADNGDTLRVISVGSGANGAPSASNLGRSLSGQYGHLILNADGSYTYIADSAAAASLNAGQSATEVFTYRVADSAGARAQSTLTLTIQGTGTGALDDDPATEEVSIVIGTLNAPPVALGDRSGVLENASTNVASTSGVLANDSDPNGNPLTVTGVAVGASTPSGVLVGSSLAGNLGHLTLLTNGSYIYTADTADALSAGQIATDTFTYQVNDGQGGVSTATLTIAVTGTNDLPVLSADEGAVYEDATLTRSVATGVLSNDRDIDNDTLVISAVGASNGPLAPSSVAQAVVGTYGSLTMQADGSYAYTASTAAANQLKAGEVRTDHFSYQVSDGHGGSAIANLAINITGTNDAPIATPNNQGLAEDASISIAALSGVLANDSDVDGDTLIVTAVAPQGNVLAETSVGQPIVGIYGHLTLNADGSYHYAADTAAANRLKQGEVRSENFIYQIADGQGGQSSASLTISVTGTNDGPWANADLGGVSEDAVLTLDAISGVLTNDSDVDQDTLVVAAVAATNQPLQAGSVGTAVLGIYGHLTMNPDGSYSYAADTAAANSLKLGEIRTDNFSYQVSDGHGGTAISTLSISVTGANDTPVASSDSGNLAEEATLFVPASTGVLSNDADVDNDTLVVSAVSAQGSALNSFNLSQPTLGTYGHLTLNPDGSYAYTANTAAANGLKAGQVGTDTFTYLVSDNRGGSSSATLNISITGTNDGPTANSDVLTLSKDSSFSANVIQGTLSNDSDPDGDTLVVVALGMPGGDLNANLVGQTILTTYGHLTMQANGSYTFSADTPAALALGSGQSQVETFTYQISDGQGGSSSATLAITISGSNNGPVAQMDSASIQENATLTVAAAQGLLLNDSDTNGDVLRVEGVAIGAATPLPSNLGLALAGTYGHLTVSSSGAYSYSADTAAANALKQGQVSSDVFTYQIADGAGGVSIATLTLTVTGTNDIPLASADIGSVRENSTLTRTASTGVLANDSDVDQDSLMIASVSAGPTPPAPGSAGVGVAVLGTYGRLTLNADGSYTYAANTAAADALKAGETRADVFSYRLADGQGGGAVTTLTINVTGTNDAPVANPDTRSTQENATLYVAATQGVLVNDRDVDGDPLSVNAVAAQGGTLSATAVGQSILGTYGHLTLNANGSYTYAADTMAVEALKLGEVQTDRFTYRISNGRGGSDTDTLTISVTGTNDLPIIHGGSNAVDEGKTLTDSTGLLASASDIDGDTLGVTGFAAGTSYTNLETPGSTATGTYGHLEVPSVFRLPKGGFHATSFS